MTRPTLLLFLALVACNKEEAKPVVIKEQPPARTFCQNGVLYENPKWDETGRLGFLIGEC